MVVALRREMVVALQRQMVVALQRHMVIAYLVSSDVGSVAALDGGSVAASVGGSVAASDGGSVRCRGTCLRRPLGTRRQPRLFEKLESYCIKLTSLITRYSVLINCAKEKNCKISSRKDLQTEI